VQRDVLLRGINIFDKFWHCITDSIYPPQLIHYVSFRNCFLPSTDE